MGRHLCGGESGHKRWPIRATPVGVSAAVPPSVRAQSPTYHSRASTYVLVRLLELQRRFRLSTGALCCGRVRVPSKPAAARRRSAAEASQPRAARANPRKRRSVARRVNPNQTKSVWKRALVCHRRAALVLPIVRLVAIDPRPQDLTKQGFPDPTLFEVTRHEDGWLKLAPSMYEKLRACGTLLRGHFEEHDPATEGWTRTHNSNPSDAFTNGSAAWEPAANVSPSAGFGGGLFGGGLLV